VDRLSYVFRRLLQLIPVAFGVTLIVFFMIHLIPGDPARTMLGVHATPDAVDRLHKQWGLDQPLYQQYLDFMNRLLHGDLGESLFYNLDVKTLLIQRVGPTLWLLGMTTIFAVIIAVPLATLAATKKDSSRDQAIRVVPMFGLAMPSFWVGIILILLFGLHLGRLFPVGGYGDGLLGHIHSMILPAFTVALFISPILIRSLRASLLNVLESDYITTARSKGISERRMLRRHAVPAAAAPVLTLAGVTVPVMVTNMVLVELTFSIPGVFQTFRSSMDNEDYPVIMGIVISAAVLVAIGSLLVDLALAWLDPKTRNAI